MMDDERQEMIDERAKALFEKDQANKGPDDIRLTWEAEAGPVTAGALPPARADENIKDDYRARAEKELIAEGVIEAR